MKITIHLFTIIVALLAGVYHTSAQQTSAFTYQGQLRDRGTNAIGTYTLIFALYDAPSGGNKIGNAITTSPSLENGIFSVNLDFGTGAFKGDARWLDITVQNGTNNETLTPREQLLPAPFAIFADTANTAKNLIATNLTASNLTASNIIGGSVFGATFFGNGGGLTNLSAIPNMQAFNSSGTFVVPTNVTRIMVEMWGGGGGGGVASVVDDPQNPGDAEANSGGGGGGGYVKGVLIVTPGANYTISVGSGGLPSGAGGDSSFGSLISATGGGAGADATAGPGEYVVGAGGTGGGGINGQLTIQGGNGITYHTSGIGGNAFGVIGNPGNPENTAGGNGMIPGGGGSGAVIYEIIGSFPGGHGGAGLVVVYY